MPGRLRPLLYLAAVVLACCWFSVAAAAGPGDEELLVVTGKLPDAGRVVIRSGLSWMAEDAPLFATVGRALAGELEKRGLTFVAVPPSVLAPFPEGTDSVRGAPVPRSQGVRRRIMSIAEAIFRMKAMQLAREGKLPQARFGTLSQRATRSETPSSARLPSLTPRERIRFALSQEEGEPELSGHVTVPGRVPDEIATADPAVADYAVTVRFAMLWPGSGIPDEPPVAESRSGLAVGWHLLEMACYDLAPARAGRAPERVWSATAQRVAYGSYLKGILPRMVRDSVMKSK